MKELPECEKDLSKRILEGVRKAYYKLLVETASRNGKLVVERNGKVAYVSARLLLKEYNAKVNG
jgi:hypothetical protein